MTLDEFLTSKGKLTHRERDLVIEAWLEAGRTMLAHAEQILNGQALYQGGKLTIQIPMATDVAIDALVQAVKDKDDKDKNP